MREKVKEPLQKLETDMKSLEGKLQRSGQVISDMQNYVEKLKFQGKKQPETVIGNEALAKRPDMDVTGVDGGCVFSGTSSGKSANVKVKCLFLIIHLLHNCLASSCILCFQCAIVI